MNREILFRGKRLETGIFATEKACEWVYGGYAKDCSGEHIYSTMHSRRMVKVVPDTIGQYTGLTDKNGVKIFEGDIIKTKKFGKVIGRTNVNDYDIFQVVYVDQAFRLMRPNREFSLVDDGFSKFEVIGNIYDSPELLEGAA